MKYLRSILFILFCVFLIWLFVMLIRSAFRGSNNTTVAPTQSLTNYAQDDSQVEMYVDGPIIVNQEHQAMRIIVDRTQSQIQILTGYDGQVTSQRTYPNTADSYANFLASLDTAGFLKGSTKENTTPEQGKCPLGSRYIFTLHNSNALIGRNWATSCGGGSYDCNPGLARQLLVRQVPERDYYDLTQTLSLQSL